MNGLPNTSLSFLFPRKKMPQGLFLQRQIEDDGCDAGGGDEGSLVIVPFCQSKCFLLPFQHYKS